MKWPDAFFNKSKNCKCNCGIKNKLIKRIDYEIAAGYYDAFLLRKFKRWINESS